MQAHPDGCPDGWALPVEASLDQLPWAAHRQGLCGSDAWADARPAAVAAAPRPDLPDAGAEKSADPAPDVQARDGYPSGDSRSAARAEPEVPCTRDAAQSGEQSCAVPASADAAVRSAVLLQLDAEAEPKAQQAHSELLALKHSLAEAA